MNNEIREYAEGLEVSIVPGTTGEGRGRILVIAQIDDGYAKTEVDLLDLLTRVKEKFPDIWEEV